MPGLSGANLTPAQPLRVLLAEALPLVRALIIDILSRQDGVAVVGEVEATSELIAATLCLRPDLVLLDWSLGGPGIVRELRSQPGAPQVIVVTARGSVANRQLIISSGALDCLPRAMLRQELPLALQPLISRSLDA